jgi:hypothetical protein
MEYVKQIMIDMGKDSYKELKELSYNREEWRTAATRLRTFNIFTWKSKTRLRTTKSVVYLKINNTFTHMTRKVSVGMDNEYGTVVTSVLST